MPPTATAPIDAPAAEPYCPACGAVARTRFCGECGAEQRRPRDLSLRRFAAGALHELTDLDSRLLTTLQALLFRPGVLTRDYVRGGGRFLGPVRIFFLANAAYFLGQLLLLHGDTFTTTLSVQLWNPPAVHLKAALVAQKLMAEHSTLPALAARWDAVAVEHGKTLVFLLVPLYAAVLGIVLAYRRRPAVEHVVFATHFAAFHLLLLLLVGGTVVPLVLLGRLAGVDLHALLVDPGFTLLQALPLLIYLAVALRRAYGVGRASALVLTPIVILGFVVALQLYRFALFFTVYLAT